MTISSLDWKVSEVCLALGIGAKERTLISEMFLEGYHPVIIEKVMMDAKAMLNSIENDIESIINPQGILSEDFSQ
jgi:hypothetical protein